MRVFILSTFFALIANVMFGQVSANLEAAIPTKGKNPDVGASIILQSPMNGGLSIGALAGIRFSTASKVTSFRVPLMGNLRYYLNGHDDGFYPEALAGIIYSHYSTKGLVTIKSNSTRFALAGGIGYNLDARVDLGARFESVFHNYGNSNSIVLRLGFML